MSHCVVCLDSDPKVHYHCKVQNMNMCKECVWAIRGNRCPCNSHDIPARIANQSSSFIRVGVKCPNCGARVLHTGEGGHIMTCLCEQRFCYQCGNKSDTFDCTQTRCRAGWLRRLWCTVCG